MAVADLNGDGKPDIVFVDNNNNNNNNNTVNVLLSNVIFVGQTYTIDRTSPLVESIDRGTPFTSLTNGTSSLSFTVTFSEAVTGVGPADFQVVQTGTVGRTLTQVSPVSASVYTVTISGITGTGTLGLNLIDNGRIQDPAGNLLTQPSATGGISNPADVRDWFLPHFRW